MTDRVVVHTSLIRGCTIATINTKVDLSKGTPCIAIVNGKEYIYRLTHNENIITFSEDVGLKDGDVIQIY